MKKNVNDLVESWLRKADLDLQAAHKLSRFQALNNIVCFHCQQASEKYLKAYLTFLSLDVPKIHNLEKIVDLLLMKDSNVLKFKEDCAKVSPFAVESRYLEFDEVESKYSLEAIEIAEKLKEYVISQIKTKPL
ncbi:MAG: HEPN domain-containing protein [Promethearchaeota archaeon]